MAKKPRTPAPPRVVQAPKRRDTPSAGRVRDRRVVGSVVAVVVVVGIGLGLWFGGGSGSSGAASTGGKAVDFAALSNLQQGPPPWGNDTANLPDRLQPLGLSQLTNEGQVLHVHQHLDLYVNGKKVTVPALIGIYDNSFITEVHTHDATGVIHVESPVQKDFTLGQFFGEWGVKLTSQCVGTLCSQPLTWWLNGKKQTGDAARLVLASHQEIAIALGTPPTVVPQSYKFPAGE